MVLISAERSRSFWASLYSALYISWDSSIRALCPCQFTMRFLIMKVRSSTGLSNCHSYHASWVSLSLVQKGQGDVRPCMTS